MPQARHRRRRTATRRAEELATAQHRAAAAKGILAGVGTCVFVVGMVFARHSYAGHPKQPASALAASPRFVRIVRRNLLQAGVVAPAEAPPGAATAVS
jgi:hypothetical protein